VEHLINFVSLPPTAHGEIGVLEDVRLFFASNLLDPVTNSVEYIKSCLAKRLILSFLRARTTFSLTFAYTEPRTVPHTEYPISVEIQKEKVLLWISDDCRGRV